jgi:hypothetical protein
MNNSDSLTRLNELEGLLQNIKIGLCKKERIVYEGLIERLHKFSGFTLQQFHKEMEEFKKTDSDNEESYPEEIRNMEDDADIASISDYETDTDDEEYKVSEIKLKEYDNNMCEKLYKLILFERFFEI